MSQVLFIHGGGAGGYEADAGLAASLQRELGPNWRVHYPRMPADESPDFGWAGKIGQEIAALHAPLFLVGHSLGASMLLKYLSENDAGSDIRGIFLLATPFWRGDEEWQKGLILRQYFEETVPRNVPVFLYHNQDDEEVDVADLDVYAEKLPRARIRKAASGGHQFVKGLSRIADDIKAVG